MINADLLIYLPETIDHHLGLRTSTLTRASIQDP
jgi:hypothetical protein